MLRRHIEPCVVSIDGFVSICLLHACPKRIAFTTSSRLYGLVKCIYASIIEFGLRYVMH